MTVKCDGQNAEDINIPVGEYLFNHRAANVSVNGQTFISWFVEEYLFGKTGAGDPRVSGCKCNG